MGYHLYPSLLPLTIGCRLLHRKVSQTFPEMMLIRQHPGRPAIPDTEIVAMLARAAERVGLEWKPPLHSNPSRLDDWFLGVARGGSQGPFFLKVYDELTGSWTVPFTARNCHSVSSSLTTFDGGAAQGYMVILLVELLVAMLLCPNSAATCRGKLLLPSWACSYLSALTGSTYAAC